MAVAFETATKVTTSFSGGSGNLSVPPPTGLASGDAWVIITVDDNNGSDGVVTVPAGWTDLTGMLRNNQGFPASRAFYKIAGASEANVSVAFGSGTYSCVAHSIRLSGVDGTNTIGFIGTTSGNTITALDAPDLTIQNNGSLALLFCSFYRNNDASVPTGPTGTTAIQTDAFGGFQHSGVVYELVNAGSYAPGNWTFSSADAVHAATIEFKPVGAGPNPSNDTSVEFVGAVEGAGTSVSLASLTILAGDYIIDFAYRDGSTTAPTLASGYTNIQSGGANTNSQRVGFKVATGGETVSGTWANATGVMSVVYRNVTGIGASAQGGAASLNVAFPALSLTDADGTSIVVGLAAHRSTNVSFATAPTDFTSRYSNVDANSAFGAYDTGTGGVGAQSWAGTTKALSGTSSGWRAVSIELTSDPPAAGTTYNESLNESASASDTPSVAVTFNGSRAESGSAADSPSVSATVNPSLAETATAAETPTGSATVNVSRTETGSAADTPTVNATVAPSRTESATALDSSSVVATANASRAESGAAVDAPTGSAVVNVSRTETLAAADNVSAGSIFEEGVTEALAAADTPSGVKVVTASASESVAAADTATVVVTANASVTETASVLDSPSAGSIFTENVDEAASATDTATVVVTANLSRNETLTSSDLPSVSATVNVSRTETLSASESVSNGSVYNSSVSETLAATDTSTVVLIANPSRAETIVAAETVSATAIVRPSRAETLSAVDSVSNGSVYNSTVSETLTAADNTSVASTINVSRTETLTAVDTTSCLWVFAAALAEAADAQDAVGTVTVFFANCVEQETLVDLPSYEFVPQFPTLHSRFRKSSSLGSSRQTSQGASSSTTSDLDNDREHSAVPSGRKGTDL